jgi:hypothetical protein
MGHVVLLGDSIFDNAAYVPGGPSVIEHLRKCLPKGWRATLAAVDGACVQDVERQLPDVPDDATHLVLSVGGNDALGHSGLILDPTRRTSHEILSELAQVRDSFRREYRQMMDRLRAMGKPVIACTIYDSVPGLGEAEHAALCLFNDAILREAFRAASAVIDLRAVCDEASDYAKVSPIEPSDAGGAKIARVTCRVVTDADVGSGECRVFA